MSTGTKTVEAAGTAVRVRPAGYGVVRIGARGRFLLHRRAALVAVALIVLLAAVCVCLLYTSPSPRDS